MIQDVLELTSAYFNNGDPAQFAVNILIDRDQPKLNGQDNPTDFVGLGPCVPPKMFVSFTLNFEMFGEMLWICGESLETTVCLQTISNKDHP